MLTERYEGKPGPAKRAATKLLAALREEGALLELGEVVDQIVPILASALSEGAGNPVGEMALGALQGLRDAGLLVDPDGHLDAAAEDLRAFAAAR
mmetsp:Transcript_127665/g.357466  ORF Transcript_127665/g.357466 Transcript_127665/m.357466 type:complete len:95 (-) Transcript_127665:39-323(-)